MHQPINPIQPTPKSGAADGCRSTEEMIRYRTQFFHQSYKHIALDLGYSRDKATCGIMHDEIKKPIELTFGNAIMNVKNWIDRNGSCILTIEAVLSTYHNKHGNPDILGDFEKGRGWYYGPGVVTFAAAMRFLNILGSSISENTSVYLAEAFLSFKKKRTNHSSDAQIIYDRFWQTKTEKIKDGTEPILDIISDVPSVRVFTE
jgi:hypothetical protein